MGFNISIKVDLHVSETIIVERRRFLMYSRALNARCPITAVYGRLVRLVAYLYLFRSHDKQQVGHITTVGLAARSQSLQRR